MAYQVTVLGKVMGPDGEQHIEEIAHEQVDTWGGVVERLVDCLMAGVPLYRADVQQVPHEAHEEARGARPTLPTLAEALTRKTVLHPDGQPVDVPALLAAARGTGSARASTGAKGASPRKGPRKGRRRMTAEQKQQVRERMRAYWASPKGQKQKRTMRAAMRARTTQAKAKAKAKG